MRKFYYLFILIVISCNVGLAQSRKSVSILGDSYSTFEGFMQPKTNSSWYSTTPKPETDVTSVKQTWWNKFIEENGYQLCINNSFSGSTICNTGYDKADFSDRSFITRMPGLGFPDIILIFGGTNDSWADSPLGDFKYGGWTKDDLFKFRPAMAYMLDHVIHNYQNVEIYFILNTDLKKEINDSVKNICQHYGIACVELQNIDKKNGHPTIKGMAQISEQLKMFIAENSNALDSNTIDSCW